MSTIAQVTVYADIHSEELLRSLVIAATTLCKNATIHTVPLTESADPLAFMKLWEKERDDVWSYVNNDIPLMRRFECFVTDSKNRKDGAVAYALYYRQMPVLSLATGLTGVEEIESEVSKDWITTALYSTVDSLGCSSLVDALFAFFTFPAVSGKVITVEGDCAALVVEQCQLLRKYIHSKWNMPLQLVGAAGCDLLGLNTDGTELQTTEEEEEISLYAPLITDLLNIPELQCISEADPQLHGALSALNRHHNLRLLRYRLQRGINVINCRPLSFVFEELVGFCRRKEMTMAKAREVLATVIKSIQHFEFYWLGLPKPEVVFVYMYTHADISTDVAMSTLTSSSKWTACLFDEEACPVVDALSDWKAVKVGTVVDDDKETLGCLNGEVLDVLKSVFASLHDNKQLKKDWEKTVAV